MLAYWLSSVVVLPIINIAMYNSDVLNAVFWSWQAIGGVGIVVASTMFMVETQRYWWEPAPTVLGWHIGASNALGGVGFLLSSIFGFYDTETWATLQTAEVVFWGMSS